MTDRLSFTSVSLNRSDTRLLEHLSEKEFWNYAEAVAHAHAGSRTGAEEYLLFDCGSGRCMLPLVSLHSIVPPPHTFTRLPAVPSWIIGLIAWRGLVLPAIDLGIYLRGNTAPLHSDGLILIVTGQGTTLALIVSAVGLTTTVEAEQIAALPDQSVFVRPEALKGIHAGTPVIDAERILTDVVQDLKMTSYNQL